MAAHHSSQDDPKISEFTKEFFQEFIDKSLELQIHSGKKIHEDINKILELGPTHRFPEGKFTEHDEGEIQFAVYAKDGKVVINFGSRISWMATTPDQAITMGRALIKHARKYLGMDDDTQRKVGKNKKSKVR